MLYRKQSVHMTGIEIHLQAAAVVATRWHQFRIGLLLIQTSGHQN